MKKLLPLLLVVMCISAGGQTNKGILQKDLQSALQHNDVTAQLRLLVELNTLYERHRQLDEQADVLSKIVSIWRSNIDPNSVGYARYSVDLAEVEGKLGKEALAEQRVRSGIAILDQSGPLYAAATVHAERVLTGVLKEEGKKKEAKQLSSSLPASSEKVTFTAAPRLLSTQEPEYTSQAHGKQIVGSIKISLVVDKAGSVGALQVTSPLGFGLDEKVMQAVQRWKFVPAMARDKPVDAHAAVEVYLGLPNAPH